MNPRSRVESFQERFNSLGPGRLAVLDELYSPDVVFEDPIHRIEGLEPLREYFARMYEGVAECRFVFEPPIVEGDRASLAWTMELRHRRFRPKETLRLPGCSRIRFESGGERAEYHRDYFDLGAMLYERVPALGAIVKRIKRNL